jgi:hypothetical protein
VFLQLHPMLFRAQPRRRPHQRLGALTLLQTRWHGLDLDRLLAAGVDPSSTDELLLRAAQVTSRRALRRTASAIDSVVDVVDKQRAKPAHVVPVSGETIRQARPALLGLVQRLRDDDVVGPRAGAMVSYLVRAGDSPLHASSAGRRLRNFAHDASELIDAERQRRRELRRV